MLSIRAVTSESIVRKFRVLGIDLSVSDHLLKLRAYSELGWVAAGDDCHFTIGHCPVMLNKYLRFALLSTFIAVLVVEFIHCALNALYSPP